MERLTEKVDGGYMPKIPEGKPDMEIKWDIYDKLGKYEDAEDKGLVTIFPCKVGDPVYVLVDMNDEGKYTRIKNDVVKCIYLSSKNEWKIEFTYIWHDTELSDVGKTVFLTRPEAEKALADMEVQ